MAITSVSDASIAELYAKLKEENAELHSKLKDKEEENAELHSKLKDKEEELKDMEELNQVLIIKERSLNDEVQDGRKALITAMYKVFSRCEAADDGIGVKNMGEIDPDTFMEECSEIFTEEEYEERATEMWELWQGLIMYPMYNFFKVVEISDDKFEKVIREDEPQVACLREEWGEDLYNTVTSALMDMDEYNPSGRFVVPELWNFMKEVIEFMVEKLTALKRKHRRYSM